MAYTYRNVKTNEVINTTNKVSGKNWVPVEDIPPLPVEKATAEDSVKDTPAVEEAAAEDSVMDAPAVEESVVAAPKKTSRRGKK